MENCIFCDIAAGLVPSRIVYEDDYSLVFLDTAGDVDGHMLAIPKKHAENLFDCGPDCLCRLAETVRKVARHCVENCGYSGVNLLHASGKDAGQSVPHFHIHIIPRKEKDKIDAWPKFDGAVCSLEEMYCLLKMDNGRQKGC